MLGRKCEDEMSDWTRIEAYIAFMPPLKRARIPPTSAQLAEELFLYTQRALRDKRA